MHTHVDLNTYIHVYLYEYICNIYTVSVCVCLYVCVCVCVCIQCDDYTPAPSEMVVVEANDNSQQSGSVVSSDLAGVYLCCGVL